MAIIFSHSEREWLERKRLATAAPNDGDAAASAHDLEVF